jgi:hypothetical protein
MEITQDYLKEIFDYKDGNLIWKVKKSNSLKIGDICGSKNNEGYIQTSLNGKKFKNHRLIWMWHYGVFPELIDHIDHNPSNNKIENLRIATQSENFRNRPKATNNTSGYKGVSFHKHRKKFQAKIKINGKQIYLGLFDSAKDAHNVYCIAAKEHHGEFWRA